MANTPTASIVIPSWQRPLDLDACLRSLERQTWRDYEVIVLKERGPLAAIRNQGLRKAKGDIVCFIDDDTVCPTVWLSNIIGVYKQHPNVAGVTGCAIIPEYYKLRRDLFRYKQLKHLYDRFLLDSPELPGHISRSGAFTTAASEENCTYEGEVEYLEACNMSFKKEIIEKVGGFDEAFGGIGDWSEPDLCFRIRSMGHRLWFSPKASLFHQPSISGAYHLRKHTGARLSNYGLFSKRWVKPSFRHSMYWGFLYSYYGFKELKAWLNLDR